MFLHSGAGLHGHEYSSRPAPGAGPALNRRSPLLRSPFGPPLARSATAPTAHLQAGRHPPSSAAKPDQPSEQQLLPQSCLPQRPSSRLRRSTADEPVVRFQEPLELTDALSEKHEPLAIVPAPAVVVSEDEGSCSEASDAPSSGVLVSAVGRSPKRRRQRLPRKSNTFFFARPAPKLVKTRLIKQLVRPKLLLQLHHVSVDKRPTPLLDIFPATTIAGAALGGRYAKRFPRVFNGLGDRNGLGSQDMILLRSEEYCTAQDSYVQPAVVPDDEDNLNRRELVAVLSPLRRQDRTEIVLDNGNVWVAEPLPNGSFEFTCTDIHGLTTTARWVRRSLARGTSPTSPSSGAQSSDQSGSPPSASSWATAAAEYRYTFSIIDPLSRRHPIMATLTQNTLEVLENYTTVSPSCGKYPPSRPFSHSIGHSMSSDDDDEVDEEPLPKSERQSKPVDAATRNLISITAVWVNLRLSGIMSSNERSLSLRGGTSAATQRRHSGSPTTMASGGVMTTTVIASEKSANGKGASLPRRATSTGAAYMQRRMQLSDASDSDRAVAAAAPSSRLRSRGRRVLSGDWNVGAWKRSSVPQTPTLTAAEVAGFSLAEPRYGTPKAVEAASTWPLASSAAGGAPLADVSRPASAQSAARIRAERRAQSAFVGQSPITALQIAGLADLDNSVGVVSGVDPNSRAGALAALEAGTIAPVLAAETGKENTARPDKGWKRVSGWFRRLGR